MKRFMVVFLSILSFSIAEAANTPQKEPDTNQLQLEDIVVTAQKKSQNIQDVPISLTVFDELDIEDKNIESVKDIAPFTSNLMFFDNSGAGNFTTTIRGIQSSGSSFSSSAGIFIDGIPILFSSDMDETLMDIERIEVLKGPQGTLYGKDTESGAINIITQKPDNDFRGKVGVEFGSDNKRKYSLNTSGPLIKNKVYLGISGQHYEKDGLIKNTYLNKTVDDKENNYGKMTLRWTPLDVLDISLISTKSKTDDGRYHVNDISASDPVIHSDLDEYCEADSLMNSLKIEYNHDSYQFTSITTQRKVDNNSLTDYDFSVGTTYHVLENFSYEKMSQELRLGSKNDAFNWLVGFYADKDDNILDNTASTAYGLTYSNYEFTGDSIGIFANIDYKIYEKIELTTGLRYDKDNKEFKNKLDSSKDNDFSGSEVSPKLTLKYTQSENLMAYATIAKGYRSGGFHPYTASGYDNSYDEESLWNYEIGWKTSFLNKRVTLNGAVYYMDIDNMQVKSSLDKGFSYMSNAAKATSKGFELEATVMATNSLKFFSSVGYNVTEFDEFEDYYGNYKGKMNPYAPKYNYCIGAQYRNFNGFYARAELNGYGKTYLDNMNKYSREAFNLVNAKAGYETEHFDIYLYANNLFDENYDSIGAYGGYYRIYSNPREVGVTVLYKF